MSIKQEPEGDMIVDSQIYKFPGRSKSSVWNHFGFQRGLDGELDKSRAVCKICRHGIRYSGNTTNLHCHLTKHRRQNPMLFTDIDESWMNSSPDAKYEMKLESLVQSTVEDTKPGNIQSTTGVESQQSKHQQLNDTIVNFFIEHLLPLSVVESTSFYSMIAVADPMYVVPDKEILFGNLIQQTFNETKKSIVLQISGNEVIALAEVWESIDGEKFVSIMCQMINALWQMKTFLLKTVSLNDIPNEDAFWNLLKGVFSEWGIKGSVALLNDGSKIMQKACTSMNLVNLECCSKVIVKVGDNFITNRPMKKTVVEYVVFLTGHVLQSKMQNVYVKIFEIVKDFKEIDAKTIQWSAFTSIAQCLIEYREVVMQNAPANEQKTDDMWQQISDMSTVLSPLLKAYNLLTDRSNVVSSMILPVLRKLEMELAPKKEDSEFCVDMKKEMWQSVSEPFRSTEVRNFLLICSLLDPRYKDLKFVEATEKIHARDYLATIATEMYRDMRAKGTKDTCVYEGEVIVVEDSGDIIRIEPMEKRQKFDNQENSNCTDDWLADVVCKDGQPEKESGKNEKVMVEIDHYISTVQISTSPLQWWSSREGLYPTLSRLAKRYLCITSFNIADNEKIRNAKMSTGTIDSLLFLHHHYYCQ